MTTMKTKICTVLLSLIVLSSAYAQIDKDALSLSISKAEEANNQKLKQYTWKRNSDVFIDSQLKLTTLTLFSFSTDGKLETKIIDAETTVKKKPGVRGAMQKNAAEDKLDYIEKALALSLKYAFMSKGELLDFISKAKVTEKNGLIEAIGYDVVVKGDRLLILVDPKTYLYTYKEFSSLLGADKVDGKLNYEKFSNGTNHGSTTMLNMPVQKMAIEAKNIDYSIRVN